MQLKKRFLFLLFLGLMVIALYFNTGDSTKPSPSALPSFVDGWDQNTSKIATDYISETLQPQIFPKSFCGTGGLLLVVVNIRPDNYEARQAIRESWGQKRANVTVYFLVGETGDNDHNRTKLQLQSESEKHNDVIQEHFIDSYNNLTLKSINMLKLFHLYCAHSYKYLLKIDDDVFLNVDNLLEMLENRNSTKNLLVGKLIANTTPFRDPTNKWYVPYELYPEKKYPDYICGPAYLMSSDVADKIYSCTLKTPLFHIEDVYITGICAKQVNVTPRHDAKFTCWNMGDYICSHRELYTIHYYKPDQMRKSYRALKEKKCYPRGSVTEWIYSLFW